MAVQLDEHGYIKCDDLTFKTIAIELESGNPFMASWTDKRKTTHLDLLFTLHPVRIPEQRLIMQGGMFNADLFVSVMRMGAFGFEVYQRSEPLHGEYIMEKFFMGGEAYDLAEFLNGVIDALRGTND